MWVLYSTHGLCFLRRWIMRLYISLFCWGELMKVRKPPLLMMKVPRSWSCVDEGLMLKGGSSRWRLFFSNCVCSFNKRRDSPRNLKNMIYWKRFCLQKGMFPFKIMMPYLEYIRVKFQVCSLVFLWCSHRPIPTGLSQFPKRLIPKTVATLQVPSQTLLGYVFTILRFWWYKN